jgi:hypothetical protein
MVAPNINSHFFAANRSDIRDALTGLADGRTRELEAAQSTGIVLNERLDLGLGAKEGFDLSLN